MSGAEMKVSVLHYFCEYRGDHSADIAVAHDLRPGETVDELVQRLLITPATKRAPALPRGSERIELRVVLDAAPHREEGSK